VRGKEMIKISRTGIRNLASNDVTYARGLQYYKENRVVSASYSNSSKTYRLEVQGNYRYSVTIEEQEDGSFDYSCNCPSRLKDQGACKHVVAALLFILTYQERTLLSTTKSPEERKIIQILDYFAAQEDTHLVGETFSLEPIITIPSMLKGEAARAYVSFYGGSNRKYKIQTIKKFLSDIYNNENFSLGKEFKYISGESTFDKFSQNILDYLLEIYEIQEVINNSLFSKIFSKSHVIMTKNMLLKFLNFLEDYTFTLELYGKIYSNVRYVKGNPRISYQLTMDDETIIVDYKGKDVVIPITDTGELLYYDGVIYKPDKKFINNFKPFYNTLGRDSEPLVFKGEKKNRFLENVLPRISETMELEVPEELKNWYISEELQASIYFDKHKYGIKAELRYRYGDYEFNSFGNADAGPYIIVRQRESEDAIISEILKLGFVPYKNYYLLKDEDLIYEFLSGKVKDLEGVATLYYSEDFKKLGIRPPGTFSASVRVNSGVNLLELDFSFEGVPKEEIRDLIHAYQIKKKYYRLKNGSFINLEEGNVEQLSKILSSLNAGSKNIEGSKVFLEKSNAVYLEKVFEEKNLQLEKDRDFTHLTERILNPAVTDFKVPDEIHAELRPYQVTGYKWLRTLAEYELGGILADDMGLGKTLQSIVFIASVISENETTDKKPHCLIVCPTSLTYNWLDEIENFAPFLNAVVVNGSPQDRKEIIYNYQKFDVLITSYPLIRRDITMYENIDFHTIFIDEAQFIKNDSSLNAKSVKRLRARHRFALTGTPIENNLSELWSIFDFIMPGYLHNHARFVEVYEKPILKDDKEALEDLHQLIAPFILRRMKKDVLTELPDKYESKILTELTEEQKQIYVSYLENIRIEIRSEIDEGGIEKSRMKILAALTRLRQICCHPSTFLENYQGGSGKLDLLMELITEAIANDHRILVFSQFTSMLRIIEEELKDMNIQYFYLEGSTPTEERNESVKRFNQGECQVFLISLKAGGTGLNLVGADTVIHYDPWWNPAVEEQATDRVYRIGQQNKVHVLKLITKGTIEEKIFKLQRKKKELSDSVITSKEVFINTLTKEELEELFGPM